MTPIILGLVLSSLSGSPALQSVQYEDCGPRCQEHRREEARERERERERRYEQEHHREQQQVPHY